MKTPKLDSRTVTESELDDVLNDGATVELISYAPIGQEDVSGWYLLLMHPNRGYLLLINRKSHRPRIILTNQGCFTFAKRYGLRSITLPVVPMIHDPNDIWVIYNERNYKWDVARREKGS